MSEKKVIIGFVVVTALVLAGGIFLLTKSSTAGQVEISQNVKAEAAEKTFDWGNIPMYKGNVTKTFTIKNSGTDTLKLINIRTSCHCTQAQVKIDGQSSPFFGMSTVSSWIGEVVPGREAQLDVIFDPAYHGPQGVGPINRFVSVETNDPNNKTLDFSVAGTVVKE
ncbi:MAG: hypothetical protein UU73_C0001G0265 [Candidatus Daviesbacteria bacterium GW2011_GWA1_41_61]|uniref:DUF1573 domain-containing protein n=1 Tax=Candidatus Daviesbacteria bacterium GW2011_GWA2_40_9 TaxID=1618424 RepID=A0A0G0U8D2_9BACT|nr:MAG: hypothetical protein UU26_C0013G0026 [Candidatus Daviesbacteria bacterium GW2011_GWC1_40_9]KKR83516.1 MAG: hypothetical protein UU29_C0004G0017 [Candidatus Daviesbacteria bacterium GW2011_GWA2_40_9]KKR93084.1 MAG: hypothetical protein UU44_C0004G0266 [Candidatus Daviesbacteria bacterium GW2011_GWB1_41_15]KKS15628.1 MAG: hypothetical protein UU73_C0001G0265 [Candidatus Daviesbacteria bacterium GW2011_GWA1_41_61]